MAKQFVTEVHSEKNVVILINGVAAKEYNKNYKKYEGYSNPLVADLKEYEELTEGNKVHYWVWVPDIITGGKKIQTQVVSLYEKKQKAKRELILRKRDRIKKYRQQIADGMEITPDAQDIQDGVSLAAMQSRKIKDRRGMMNTLVSALNPDIFEEEFYPDSGIQDETGDYFPVYGYFDHTDESR